MRFTVQVHRVVVFCVVAGSTLGHGGLVDPLPTWTSPNSDISQFCGTMEGPSVLPGAPYNTSPQDNTAAFTRHFQASSFKTLRDVIVAYPSTCGTCGITDPFGTPRELNATGVIMWAHGSEGFVASHEGPCEVWCDATRVFYNDNCARNVASGILKIDVAKCQGARQLVMYWLALHVPTWQIYVNCVTLGGAAPTSPSQNKPSATPAPPGYTVPPTPRFSSYGEPSYGPSPPYASSTPELPSTAANNTIPLAVPSSAANKSVAAWHQCGGLQYKGPTHCVHGHTCRKVSDSYSQCVPRVVALGELNTWAQCGGKTYTGPTTCTSSDQCTVQNDYYSQCLPK
ncbi:hypothetical protein H310_05433 [Aphanomyces invadans]|uniref:CBM1 domain-containing protein n=1 Tax=Aphanomyces invadans TaxID=157072 RepID=A0A024UAT9_9STRA|nr:hypothetical protein H310_05433 [Aphanomyces invadans]ETW02997.1 hypothetical protein H310_05433 [Aphanomyces invadans]|eukprot:XP_008868381.1 hypothetical protein H310_05433 [Aphanomyces invadans]